MKHFSAPLIASFLLCQLLLVPHARAEVFMLGGAAMDLGPERPSTIRVVSQDITLELVGRTDFRVRAVYLLENTSDEAQNVALGTSESRCERRRDRNCSWLGQFREMRTTVDGASVTPRRVRPARESTWYTESGETFVFDVAFAGGQRITLDHRYLIAGGLSTNADAFLPYVTLSAKHWAGPIEHIRVTVRLPKTPWALTIDGGFRRVSYGRVAADAPRFEAVYEQNAFRPTQDHFTPSVESAQGTLTRFPCPMDGVDFHTTYTADELRVCRNLPYARHGRAFEDPALTRTFFQDPMREDESGIPPYAPHPDYRDAWLTPEDRAYTAFVRSLEQAR